MYCASTKNWYLERVIWLVAGAFALASAVGTAFHSPYWLILTALVGVNLIVFALSGFCIMANILHAIGFRPAAGAADETAANPAAR